MDMIKDVALECGIVTHAEIEVALTHALDSRNRYSNRSGYSPHQRVFGSSLRLPGCLISDDPIDRVAVSCGPSTDFQRSAEIRAAAQRAMFKEKDADAVHKAQNARSRLQAKKPNVQGTVVYVWRSSRKVRGWIGPGVVICITPKKRVLGYP